MVEPSNKFLPQFLSLHQAESDRQFYAIERDMIAFMKLSILRQENINIERYREESLDILQRQFLRALAGKNYMRSDLSYVLRQSSKALRGIDDGSEALSLNRVLHDWIGSQGAYDFRYTIGTQKIRIHLTYADYMNYFDDHLVSFSLLFRLRKDVSSIDHFIISHFKN